MVGKRGKRSSRTWGGAALVLVVIAVWMLRPAKVHHDPALPVTTTSSPPPGPSAPSASETASEATPMPPPAPRPVAAPAPPEPAPVVDEVLVEKPGVCSGEDNLITVRAHTVNGTDEFLHYVVDGQLGSSVPLRLHLGEDGKVEGVHTVTVFGRGNAAVTVPLPEYDVRDCQPEHIVIVEPHVQPNSWSDFELVARVATLPRSGPPRDGTAGHRPADPRPFVPVSYAWSFGDGETALTSAARVAHDYERRPQDTLYSYFTVRVDVHGRDGQVLTGRASLPLINPAFEAYAQKGLVQILIALDPRFPELDDSGRVVQKVRLWHTRPEPVTIDAAAVTRYFEGASGEAQPQGVDVGQLLGTSVIPPGRDGITTSVTLDTLAEPGVFSMTYRLSGHSREGHPVIGSFSVMRPPPRPTADNSEPVVDPALKAKVVAARQMLGKDVVTDDDLWRLEREGRFADLPVPASPGTAAATAARPLPQPPAMPAPGVPTQGPPVPTGVTPPPAVTSAPSPASSSSK